VDRVLLGRVFADGEFLAIAPGFVIRSDLLRNEIANVDQIAKLPITPREVHS
jgi:hypothetical protein